MYKVEKSVLDETVKILDTLVDYSIKDEEKHYKQESGRNHIYLILKKAEKLSKLIKDNYTNVKG